MTQPDPTLTELNDGAEDFINAVMTGEIVALLRDLRWLLDRPVPYHLTPTGRAQGAAILALTGGPIGGVEVSWRAQSPGLWTYDDPTRGRPMTCIRANFLWRSMLRDAAPEKLPLRRPKV